MPRKGHTVPAHQRVLQRIEVEDDCWIYQGRKSQTGYGNVTVYPKKESRAHRVVYEALVGPIPKGMEIDHLCRRRACVNPDHLEPVTHTENVRRGYWGKNECVNGHEFTEANTRHYRTTKGKDIRICRECERIKWYTSQGKDSAPPRSRPSPFYPVGGA
jgi:hypothetical protein